MGCFNRPNLEEGHTLKTPVTCVVVLGSPELNLEQSVETEGWRLVGTVSKMDVWWRRSGGGTERKGVSCRVKWQRQSWSAKCRCHNGPEKWRATPRDTETEETETAGRFSCGQVLVSEKDGDLKHPENGFYHVASCLFCQGLIRLVYFCIWVLVFLTS